MAFHTEHLDAPHQDNLASRIVAAVTALFARIADTQSRTRKIQRLAQLSDSELSQIGLRRQDIVRHVYRDTYHI